MPYYGESHTRKPPRQTITMYQKRQWLLQVIPQFPQFATAKQIRWRFSRQHPGTPMSPMVWNYWATNFVTEGLLIRLSHGKWAQPRTHIDLIYHVPPGTPAPKGPRFYKNMSVTQQCARRIYLRERRALRAARRIV